MKTNVFFSTILSIGLFFTLFSSNILAQNTQVTVSVSGIKSGKGKIVLNVFKDSDGYEKERPYKIFQFDKKALTNGSLVLKCTLDAGVYGITLLDDENSNDKMDKSFIGMPKEGFGFSNFFLEKLKKPSFEDFKIQLKNDNAKIDIKVKYM